MRIWIINHYAKPYARHHNLACELIRRGHEVSIFASSFDHRTRKEKHLLAGEKVKLKSINGVPYVWLKTPSYSGNTIARFRNMAIFAWRIWKARKNAGFKRPDIIIGSSPHLFAALAAESIARQFQIPFIFEVRDLWPQSFVDLLNWSIHHPLIWAMERIEKHLYRSADRIISLLPGAADHMVEKGAKREKIVWIPNGINTNIVPLPEPPPDDEVFTVMYAGAHGLANALDPILDAASLLQQEARDRKILIRFIGDGPEKPRLQELAKKRNLTNVRFDDSVPRDWIYDLLYEADSFVMPLKNSPVFRWGISPNKLFDYLMSARPVIFSVDSPFNPVAEAQAGLTIPPEDSYALARAIKSLLDMSPEERWEMGMRGRKYAEKYHNFTVLVDKLEEMLEIVMD